MSDKIVDNIIDRIDTYLDRIEELLDDLSLIRSDHKELVDSIYEFYLDLEKAVDRVADIRKDEKELRDSDWIEQEIQDHVKKYSSAQSNKIREYNENWEKDFG